MFGQNPKTKLFYTSVYIGIYTMRKITLETGNLVLNDEVAFFFEKTVTPFGNGAKIDAPKGLLGKRVYIIVCKDESRMNNNGRKEE